MWYLKNYGLILLLILSGCNPGRKPVNDYGSDNNEYSRRFAIENREHYRRISVLNPWQGAERKNFEYFVCSDLTKLPAGLEESQIIKLPVKSIICTSTTHIAMLDALEAVHMITGVSGSGYVYNPELRAKIDSGDVFDIGYDNGYNTELIYSLDPDIMFVYGVGNESVPAFSRLSEMGIPVVYIADYLEEHPLARTEWIKVFGEMLDRQELAEQVFSSVKNEYNTTLKIVGSNTQNRPEVMLGLPFKDTWFISPGNSYISKLITDAGGKYLWEDTESNISIPMSLEAVMQEAVDADIWLNTGIAGSIDEIKLIDHRLVNLPVISKGSVYNNNNRLNSMGGNDYWESGTVNPHLLLKDIASIINPDLFPGHELVYYTRLKSEQDTRYDR